MSEETKQPAGEKREVVAHGGAAIDGAPVAYVVVLAAVIAALAFIPMSVVMASGGSFPMSQGVLPLLGWVLGPIGGAVSAFIGTLIGVFIAPHTAGVPVVSILGAVVASLAAGYMVHEGKGKAMWIPILVVIVAAFFVYIGRALFINNISPLTVFLCTIINWTAILLWALPTRTWLTKMIQSDKVYKLAPGLFLGTWMTFGLSHAFQSSITYTMFNWPEEVWLMLIPMMPFEQTMRSLVASVIGTGVIIGLRAIGVVKPAKALY